MTIIVDITTGLVIDVIRKWLIKNWILEMRGLIKPRIFFCPINRKGDSNMSFILWLEEIKGMKAGLYFNLSSSDQNEIYEEYKEFKEESNECN